MFHAMLATCLLVWLPINVPGWAVTGDGGRILPDSLEEFDQPESTDPASDTVAGGNTAIIYDARWTIALDTDGDSCIEGTARLSWDPDVADGSGQAVVYEKVWYKEWFTIGYILYYTSPPHTIDGNSVFDQQYVDIPMKGNCTAWDYLIEVYRVSQPFPDQFRDERHDIDLNDHREEPLLGDTAVIYDARWSLETDIDGDHCIEGTARLHWDPDVADGVGSILVYEKVFWKGRLGSVYTLQHTTEQHTIDGLSTADQQFVDIPMTGNCEAYDYWIEVWRVGLGAYDNVRNEFNDAELNDHFEEPVVDPSCIGGNRCNLGCPDQCNLFICPLSLLCNPQCGGSTCNVGCNPGPCGPGCGDECSPFICLGNYCDTSRCPVAFSQCDVRCAGSPCNSGCPNRCDLVLCTSNALCDPACHGSPCNIGCDPGPCGQGCGDECSPLICLGNYCDTTRCPSTLAHCDLLCGGHPCNPGCPNECSLLCPLNYCNPRCHPAPRCDPTCSGGNLCHPGCTTQCDFYCLDNRRCNPACPQGSPFNANCNPGPCGLGSPNECNHVLCPENTRCRVSCGGNPCEAGCICEPDCPLTRCSPFCPGGDACAVGCPLRCDPTICACTACSDPQCQPGCEVLCGGDPCNVRLCRGNDCNTNRRNDDCDVRSGASRDEDGDTVPDECEVTSAFVDCMAGPGHLPRPGPGGIGDMIQCLHAFDRDGSAQVDLIDFADFMQNPQPTPPAPLSGWVDMHTHPMSHLAFGGKLLHGAPDVGSLIPAGTHNCNRDAFRATTMEQALGNCDGTHGGWGYSNPCGNYIRAIVLHWFFDDEFEHNLGYDPFGGGNVHGDHRHEGIESAPPFHFWPHQTSKAHQQMWWEWIERAHRVGGLSVMIALSHNSEMLAQVMDGDAPIDDKTTADIQIDEITSFVCRHGDFMEIAYSSADLRRIVGANKLAVILGMEVDNIGNFNKPGVEASERAVAAELQRLWDKGVRYVFPIHIVDNKFGGAAVYSDLFNFSNKYSTGGSVYAVESSRDPLISFRLGTEVFNYITSALWAILEPAGGIPYPPAFHPVTCPIPVLRCSDTFQEIQQILAPELAYLQYLKIPGGHVNAQGLTELGEFAIEEMMRLGMLIDIDHMSEKSVRGALNLAERIRYPVNVGHNGIRNGVVPGGNSERIASTETAERVAALKGVFGVGTANVSPQEFIERFRAVRLAMGDRAFIAIGTDVNGLEPLPKASAGLDSEIFYSQFSKAETVIERVTELGTITTSRTWDYTTEGVAHYGLMADFLKDVRERDSRVYEELMNSAEAFAQMWEAAEAASRTMP